MTNTTTATSAKNCVHPNDLFVSCTYRCSHNQQYRIAVRNGPAPACHGTHTSGQVARDCVGGILDYVCDKCYDYVMLKPRLWQK